MPNSTGYLNGILLHDLILDSAQQYPTSVALVYDKNQWTYQELSTQVKDVSESLAGLGLQRMDRVGIYLEKCFEFVVSAFAVSCAGGVFVPINHILKGAQIQHILNDCQVTILVTSAERFPLIESIIPQCPHLKTIIIKGEKELSPTQFDNIILWKNLFFKKTDVNIHRVIDADVVSIFYTSGSTGKPKGVVLSHKNMVAGAKSVASYLENDVQDVLIAALPLSFDAGFSQLTTAFYKGAKVVLTNYLTAHDLMESISHHKVTGMTAVPPLWIQLVNLKWPSHVADHLRYFANTGGKMPFEILQKLRSLFPKAKPYLMYGLTEAFRATYLAPEEVDKRPDSIGKSIPNSEVLVLNEAGKICVPGEVGELVQRGALVSLGYWNDPEKTTERFKILPSNIPGRHSGLIFSEMAVFSGDYVKMDNEGFLYFIGRKDEMIKTSGYRVSPNEIEEIVYSISEVAECAAFGVEDKQLGQSIILIILLQAENKSTVEQILSQCRKVMPSYMVPSKIVISAEPLPRNPNGKIDRKRLTKEFSEAKSEIN